MQWNNTNKNQEHCTDNVTTRRRPYNFEHCYVKVKKGLQRDIQPVIVHGM